MKTYFVSKILKAITFPEIIRPYFSKEEGLVQLTGHSKAHIEQVAEELRAKAKFIQHLWGLLKKVGVNLNFDLDFKIDHPYLWQAELYIVCRLTTPKIVVETGVEHGISTSFILEALEDNNKGFLYSVDFPPEGIQSGWIVP